MQDTPKLYFTIFQYYPNLFHWENLKHDRTDTSNDTIHSIYPLPPHPPVCVPITNLVFARFAGFVQTLKHCFFQDLQRPNSRVFQDSKNAFSRTFQDTIRSQTWLHEVKKSAYQISFRCNCITVNEPKCNTCGDKMHTMYTVRHEKRTKFFYYNFYNTWTILIEIDMQCLG